MVFRGSSILMKFPHPLYFWLFIVAMLEAEKSGIPRFLNPHDMADPKVDHLGPMAYVAWHRKIGEPLTVKNTVS